MSLDGQGRLLLNEELRKCVDLIDENEAVVFGNGNKVEIWNCKQFADEVGGISVEEVEDILDEFDI